jgi:hypothetical protein
MWSDLGLSRILTYTGVYWPVAGLLLWRAPRCFAPAAAGFVLLYTVWWSGLAAPLAVLYFLGSCYFLGRWLARESDALTSLMLGTAAWMLVIWFALHVPVNRPAVYFAAFGLPYLQRFKLNLALRPAPPALGLVGYVLTAYWFTVLKPDVSSDGLSMHLALPSIVADLHRWPFDFQNQIWSLMPAAVDGLYAGVFLLGGEFAARLLNFAYLVVAAAFLVQIARRWVWPERALVAAALFASTPLTALVTGSLFIENVWTALILAAVLALLRYLDHEQPGELVWLGVFTGAAFSAKLIAGAYIAPIICAGAFFAMRARRWRALAIALLLAALCGLPPYAYAWAKTGNPVFPFSNAVFKSPYYYSDRSFDDVRYHAPLSWKTPYDLTFRSGKYFEGTGGGAGFQYLFLLLPAVLLIRRRDQAVVLGIAAASALLILIVLPNLRYLYPALALLSITLALLLRFRFAWILMAALIGLNLWYMPSADGYDVDFALFRKADIAPYLERMAPARALIDHLNAQAYGEPVAFFGTSIMAGLHAPAYNDNWHSEHYWKRVRDSDSDSIAAYLKSLGVRHVVAPVSRDADFGGVRDFLQRWIDPDGPVSGYLGVFRIRDAARPVERDNRPLGPGLYEDEDPRIEYSQRWIHDRTFAEASGHSVAYSDVPGQWIKFRFQGKKVIYFFTRALNRGVAEIRIDGVTKGTVDSYQARAEWQASREFSASGEGLHTFEIVVAGRKDARSAGAYVDLDQIEVR